MSIGERIEIFVVNARGATLEEYAAGALTNVTVDRERLVSLDGLPAVVLEYDSQPGSATEAATFLLRDDAAHVFTFRRGDTVEGCSSDLATYRMLLRSFRFLGDPDASPTLLPGPDAEVSEGLCGDVLTPPAGAEELTDLIASVGCGPLTAGVGDAVVCVPGLSDVATLMCWTVAGTARDCSTGPASLTTSFDAPGRPHPRTDRVHLGGLPERGSHRFDRCEHTAAAHRDCARLHPAVPACRRQRDVHTGGLVERRCILLVRGRRGVRRGRRALRR